MVKVTAATLANEDVKHCFT